MNSPTFVKMATQTAGNIPLSSINPEYLHVNSTSHTWAFGAFAELIDNAYDPDVSAKQLWIDWTRIKDLDCLTFVDNGAGLEYDKMHKMLSFGYSHKKTIRGHVPVGQYGNGFKSGSMRLGKDAIVFSKTRHSMSVGLLSQTYLAAIKAEQILVPIVTFKPDEQDNIVPDHADSLEAILKHSLFKTEAELLRELQAIDATPPMVSTGTRIIIWNLRSSQGRMDFDFETDRYDIRIPRVVSGDDNNMDSEPESRYSLCAYSSILYLKPRMQIIIRGQKVRTQLVSKSLAHTRKDRYTPQFLKKRIGITFGYNTKNKQHYGIMMYNKKRLIRAYEHVGCQCKAVARGVGVIGIIECDFLKPTHSKQDFDDTEEYRKVKQKLGEKLEEYWNQIHYMTRRKDPKCTIAVEDMQKPPDQNWIQCDSCQKWRKLPDGIDASKLPKEWSCHQNPDPQYRTCQREEELEDSENEQPYQKTYKQEKKRQQENQQQNSEDDVPTPSTSTARSETTAGGDVTHFTPPSCTPLNSSGRRSSARHTALSYRMHATPPRSKRLLPWTPASEHGKRAKVKGHITSSEAEAFLELCTLVSQVAPDDDDVLFVEASAPDLPTVNTEHWASEGDVNPQLSNGDLAEQPMETNTTETAAPPPSAVPQQVSVAVQTEEVDKVKEEGEEEEEPKSSEQTQLPSDGGVQPLLDQVEKLKQELQQVRTSSVKPEQCEQAPWGDDDQALQLDSILMDLDRSNEERDQLKSKLESVEAERGALFSQCEQLKTELEDLRGAGSRTGNGPNRPGSTEAERLKNLRLTVSRLLAILIPALELDQKEQVPVTPTPYYHRELARSYRFNT
ncbi:hypothetical protein SKAU_G00239480 [Synaphobranchus kaupii]|uniref:CW-type domain-containing protein n=1 Tax=Synaphobranchus kaupii TaxID=118154 RepID=A0A9Q1F769_SYNKA|nr:hypothetical protein SKAU_G00239480 [Synaphobranchus kaupii]